MRGRQRVIPLRKAAAPFAVSHQQFKGTHRISTPELHGNVNVFLCRIASFKHSGRFQQVGDQEPVHDETRGIFAVHSHLANIFAKS